MEFTIKLDRYEGPYTKVLELIDARKLSITEVSLSTIADEYITYIKTLNEKDTIDISQFIVVASTLMLMKVKSLLPGIIYTEEEEKQVHDLEYKLELYTMLAQSSGLIRSLYLKTPLYSRAYIKPKNVSVFVPDERVSPALLQSVMSLTLHSFIQPKVLVKVAVEQSLRIERVIETLLDRVKNAQSISLQSLAGSASTKEEQKNLLIVNFIALLELLRTGSIMANQHADGGDITIVTSSS
jgi:segregation and condensation protein A